MDLCFSDEDRAFEANARAFLRDHLPPDIARAYRTRFHLSRQEVEPWQRILHNKGWVAYGWPPRHGGTGWTPVQRFIWERECALADAPDYNVIALHLVGPVLIEFGSAALRKRFLPGIRSGEIFFCQGFSEPQAGSDLGSLSTRAVPDGDHYVVNGQKTWTSDAQYADFMVCLARTGRANEKPSRAISMLLLPMDVPGVEVRKIETIDGRHIVNEVFLNDVRVPKKHLVGEENAAWAYTKFLLDHERAWNAHVGRLERYLGRIREVARAQGELTKALREKLARLSIQVTALQWFALRALYAESGSEAADTASALKSRGSELLLAVSLLEREVMGLWSAADYSDDLSVVRPMGASDSMIGLAAQAVYWRASSIFGGSNEIQRSIIWNTAVRPLS